jgi:hypothetical protein
LLEDNDPLTENSTCALAETGTKFLKATNNVVAVLWGTEVGNMEEIAALPTMGAS